MFFEQNFFFADNENLMVMPMSLKIRYLHRFSTFTTLGLGTTKVRLFFNITKKILLFH